MDGATAVDGTGTPEDGLRARSGFEISLKDASDNALLPASQCSDVYIGCVCELFRPPLGIDGDKQSKFSLSQRTTSRELHELCDQQRRL